MLDRDLAAFYGIEIRVLNQARKRNEKYFTDLTFQLTSEEWVEALKIQGLPPQKGVTPWAYTEKAAYKMSFVLKSSTSLKVADLILEVFISVRDGVFVPATQTNQTLQIASRIESVERDRSGEPAVVHYHNYYGPVSQTQISGSNNKVSIGPSEDFIKEIVQVMSDPQVLSNHELVNLLSKSITQANKKDKPGLLDTMNKVGDLGAKVIPAVSFLIELAKKIQF